MKICMTRWTMIPSLSISHLEVPPEDPLLVNNLIAGLKLI